MTVITLTTAFGLRDGFVGIMKGVIYGIAPQVKIVDISHEDFLEIAMVNGNAAQELGANVGDSVEVFLS